MDKKSTGFESPVIDSWTAWDAHSVATMTFYSCIPNANLGLPKDQVVDVTFDLEECVIEVRCSTTFDLLLTKKFKLLLVEDTDKKQYVIKYKDGAYDSYPGWPVRIEEATRYDHRDAAENAAKQLDGVDCIEEIAALSAPILENQQ